jgi:hypothetical protein
MDLPFLIARPKAKKKQENICDVESEIEIVVSEHSQWTPS